MNIISYNVNGLRSILKKSSIYNDLNFTEFITKQSPDILCLSEIKLNCKSENIINDILPQYKYKYWDCSVDQSSRHGVAVFSKYKPNNVSYTFVSGKYTGRYICLDYETFYLVSVYVPNSGYSAQSLKIRTDEWDAQIYLHLNKLKQTKHVIYTGDLNVVHLEKDTFNFKQQRNRVAGVYDVERENFQNLLDSGFTNVFRELYPRKIEYTYFTYLFDARTLNTGMTLDYFLVNDDFFPYVNSMKVFRDVTGSDHLPIQMTFDIPTIIPTVNIKDIIIKDLEVLAHKEAMLSNPFKVRAYQTVINQIKKLEYVKTMDDLADVKGIGPKIHKKIQEILDTGSLAAADEARDIYNLDIYDKLIKIYGIGPSKANELIETNNIKSLDELQKHQELLNENQKIGLKYFDDLQTKIPRSEMDKHDKYLKKNLDSLHLDFQIAGSYRRGLNESGDIDILISSSDPSVIVLDSVIAKLIKSKYIIEVLALGKTKFMGIVRLPSPSNKQQYSARRLDILITTPQEYPFALLYFTWGQRINIKLRKLAQKAGLQLNERGLVDIKTGKSIHLKSEIDIFRYLDP